MTHPLYKQSMRSKSSWGSWRSWPWNWQYSLLLSHWNKTKRGWGRKESERAGHLRNLGFHHHRDLEGFVVVTVCFFTMLWLWCFSTRIWSLVHRRNIHGIINVALDTLINLLSNAQLLLPLYWAHLLFWLLFIAKDITTAKPIIESPPQQREVDRVL